MIGWLNGRIIDSQQPGKLILDVQGVGYDVETSLQTFFQLNAESPDKLIGLHIHTVVREDAFLLYGFIDRQERMLFRSLIKVNGIGPKSAMAILSSITPSDFIHCIHQENASLLTKIPGVGKKTAERLIIEMRDSLKDFSSGTVASSIHNTTSVATAQQEAVSALESLGYKSQEAMSIIKRIDDGQKSCESLIREALKVIGGR